MFRAEYELNLLSMLQFPAFYMIKKRYSMSLRPWANKSQHRWSSSKLPWSRNVWWPVHWRWEPSDQCCQSHFLGCHRCKNGGHHPRQSWTKWNPWREPDFWSPKSRRLFRLPSSTASRKNRPLDHAHALTRDGGQEMCTLEELKLELNLVKLQFDKCHLRCPRKGSPVWFFVARATRISKLGRLRPWSVRKVVWYRSLTSTLKLKATSGKLLQSCSCCPV